MFLEGFKSALATAKTEPKGVKVGLEPWKELKATGLIQMRDVEAWGVFNLGFQMRFY